MRLKQKSLRLGIMDAKLLEENAASATELLTAMANQNRLMILCHLVSVERNVGEIADLVGLDQSPLSQHLAKLRALRLVKTRRQGQQIFYSLASVKVEKLLGTIYKLYCAPC